MARSPQIGALGALGGDAARVAAVAAVVGDLPFPLAAELAQLDEARLTAALDALLDAGLLRRPDLGALTESAADSVLSSLPAAERQRLHGAAARCLAAAGAPSSRLAALLLDAPPIGEPWALGALWSEGVRARDEGRAATAVGLLRRALRELPPVDVLGELLADLAVAEEAAGYDTAGERYLEAASHMAGRVRRADLHQAAGRHLLAVGRPREATNAFRAGLALHAGGDRDRLLGAGLVAAGRLDATLHDELGDERHDLLGEGGQSATHGGRAALAELALESVFRCEPVDDVLLLARRALPPAGPTPADEPSVPTLAGVFVYADAHDEALEILDRCLRAGRTSRFADATLRFRRGQCLFARGDLERAQDDLESARRAGGIGWSQFEAPTHGLLALVLLERGDLAGAEVVARRAGEPDEGDPLSAVLLEGRGRVRLAMGANAAALADFERAGAAAAAMGCRNPAVIPWRSGAGLAAAALGEVDRADEHARAGLAAARRFGAPSAVARALRALARVHGGDEAVTWTQEALALVAGSTAQLEWAWTHVELGTHLLRRGRGTDASVHLRAGVDIGWRCGAKWLARTAEEELKIAGARPRRTLVTGAGALTPSERRVVELAATGLTNREIANSLFVSVKAVEFHLRNAYRKLGVATRRELTVAIASGLVEL